MSQNMQNTKSQRIAVLRAQWHPEIVNQCVSSFSNELSQLAPGRFQIDTFDVPGALEIPLAAKKAIATGNYAAILGVALIVDGGIYRHDFVAQTVIDGIMRVQLDTGIPILSAVLTPHHFHDHSEHHEYFFRHFEIKGREVARAAIDALKTYEMFETP